MAQAVRPADAFADRRSRRGRQAAREGVRCSHSSISWPIMGRIIVVGTLGIICLLSWVRLFELEAESRRLDRLIAAEKTYKGELARKRGELCDLNDLKKTAPTLGLVEASAEPRPVWVGCLSAPQDSAGDAEAPEGRMAASADSDGTKNTPSPSSRPSTQAAMVDYDILQ